MRSEAESPLFARLAGLLAEVTGAKADTLTPESTPQNTAGWDSVSNLSFISAVEEELGVIIQTAEAIRIRSLSDMLGLVSARLGTDRQSSAGEAKGR